MAHPWFDPILFGSLYGGLAGGIGGTLAGILGALVGTLAPRGKGKTAIIGGIIVLICFGAVSVLFGLIALIVGQPYGIWYPLSLVGVIFLVVSGVLLPQTQRIYRQAEARRLEANSFRNR